MRSTDPGAWSRSAVPTPRVGVGFKHPHAQALFSDAGYRGFLEVHAENYMGAGGMPHQILGRVRRDHAISLHGVGMSIGNPAPLDPDHLRRFATLVRRYEPMLVSEHLAWSTHEGTCFNDLLPLPYTRLVLAAVCRHVDEVQEAIGRPLLLENPATYVSFASSEMSEPDFLREIAERTGCALLLDLNNVYVSAVNHGQSTHDYLRSFPLDRVREIHLAGHAEQADLGQATLLIDSHDQPVAPQVWSLFEKVLSMGCHAPTLIEWDSRLPDWSVLTAEAQAAQARMECAGERHEEARHAA